MEENNENKINFEDHFVNEEIQSFEIDGGKFEFKPITAGEENRWTKDYMVHDEEKEKFVHDFGLLNKCKLRNLISTPYSKEIIKKILGKEKEWSQLNHEERFNLLEKTKKKILKEILKNINRIENEDEEVKKD
jgi:hypothetical protein